MEWGGKGGWAFGGGGWGIGVGSEMCWVGRVEGWWRKTGFVLFLNDLLRLEGFCVLEVSSNMHECSFSGVVANERFTCFLK